MSVMNGSHVMNTAELIAALNQALDQEDAAGAWLRTADAALADAEERAEELPDNIRRHDVERCAEDAAAADAAVRAVRLRRAAIEATMHRDAVLGVYRRRLATRGAAA